MTIGGWIVYVISAICFLAVGVRLAIVLSGLGDQKSDLVNDLEYGIIIYTADGHIIREFHGKIDIKDNADGYISFDFEGKRYTYYNCFAESIAEIK